jgi:hypothetical protein
MTADSRLGPSRSWTWTVTVVAVSTVLVGLLGVLGADLLWAVALGDHIIRTASVPTGIPFASAPTQGWSNPFVTGEVLLALLRRLGDGALLSAQVVAVAVTWSLLAVAMRRSGASDRSSAVVLIFVTAGGLAAFFIARVQVLSPVLFAVLLVLLRKDHKAPSGRVWVAVPLLWLWANLHGTVLVGLAVAGSYLLCERLRQRPGSSVMVTVAASLALLATSAGVHYPDYVWGALTNAAAEAGEQMWAPLSLRSPLDVILLVALASLAILYFRHRRPAWEYVAVAGLGIGTVVTARTGFWLLIFLAAPAASSLIAARSGRGPQVQALGAVVVVTFATALGVLAAFARGDEILLGGNAPLVKTVVSEAGTRAVLAEEPLVEAIAVAGGTIWAGNPLDAFSKADQTAYLDFVAGRPGGRVALNQVDVVVVRAGGPASQITLASGSFKPVHESDGWLVYERTP